MLALCSICSFYAQKDTTIISSEKTTNYTYFKNGKLSSKTEFIFGKTTMSIRPDSEIKCEDSLIIVSNYSKKGLLQSQTKYIRNPIGSSNCIDTIYRYSYDKNENIISKRLQIRGRPYTNYYNVIYFTPNGDTSSIFFEDTYKNTYYSFEKEISSKKLRPVYYKDKDSSKWSTYDKKDNLLSEKTLYFGQKITVIKSYKNQLLTKIDTIPFPSKQKNFSKPLLFPIGKLDTIRIPYPKISYYKDMQYSVDSHLVHLEEINSFVNDLIIKATADASKYYYFEFTGNTPFINTRNVRSGIYKRGHIPYQAGFRFRTIDSIALVIPYTTPSSKKNYTLDSLILEKTKYASRKYYMEYIGYYGLYEAGKYRKGHIPCGIYREINRCYRFPAQKYSVIGQFNRKGKKDGLWKYYDTCDGKLTRMRRYKKGRIIQYINDIW